MELPIVKSCFVFNVAEAEIQIVNTLSVLYLRAEGLVLLHVTRLADSSFTDDGSILTIDTKGNLAASCPALCFPGPYAARRPVLLRRIAARKTLAR